MATAAPRRGFTFVELLVVLAIIGVLAGVVAFNFAGASRERTLQTEAERLAALVELARVESVARNEAWGLYVHAAEYGFAAYDEAARRWRRHDAGTFRSRPTPAGVSLVVAVERRRRPASGDDEAPVAERRSRQATPQVLILSSGEQTPFSVRLIPEWDGAPWIVESDGIQRTRAWREGSDTTLKEAA